MAVTVEIANDFLVTVMDIVEVMIFVLLAGVMLIVQGAVADGEVTVIWADVAVSVSVVGKVTVVVVVGVVVKEIVGVAAYTVDCSWVTVKVPNSDPLLPTSV